MISKNSILRLVTPVARGGVYDSQGLVCVEGSLRGKRFSWHPCDAATVPQTVAIPMERFIYRLIDIPPASRKVLSSQVSKFLPMPPEDIIWEVLPVAGRSFLMALPRTDWEQMAAKLRGDRQKPPMLIPSLVAAAVYHYWQHDGNGELALPTDSGCILMGMTNGQLERLELREGPPGEGVTVYGDQEIIACGAVLYSLVPHPFGRHLGGRKPFPRLLEQAVVATGLLCCGLAFLFYTIGGRDVAYLDRVKGALETIKEETRQVETTMLRNQKIETTANFLDTINADYVSPYLVLGDISAHLPPRAFLIDFFIEAGAGYLTGVSRDVTAVLQMVSSRPYIALAEFSAPVVLDKQGAERFQLRFELKKGKHDKRSR